MLKKIGVAAILLITIVSLTIGSVSPAVGQSDETGISMGYDNMSPDYVMMAHHPDGSMLMMAGHRHSNVFLDLRQQGQVLMDGATTGPVMLMSGGPGFYPKPVSDGNKEFIIGRMSVLDAGSDKPMYYSVKFYKGPAPNGTPKQYFDSYRMDPATFRMGDNGSSNFTFGGEILIMNKSIVQDNVTRAIGNQSNDIYDNVIDAGQTNYHQAQVSGSTTAFNFSLKWNNPNDDMSLTVYTPDGHILGPYTDASDGKKDDGIDMEIDNTAGVADGTWTFKVTDTGVTGKDEYYLRTW